VTAMPQL